jgi:DNA-binding NtrC family response regulator
MRGARPVDPDSESHVAEDPNESQHTPQAGNGVVLLVDDEPLLLKTLRRILESDSQRVLAAGPDGLEAHLGNPELDVVLVDLRMGRTSGLDVLDRFKRERPEVEVVVMTGHASIESAVGCMRRGAFDYLAKPFQDIHRVRTTVRKAVERRRLVRRNRELEEELRGRSALSGLVGTAPRMQALGRAIRSLRHSASSVLVVGESGTGKELVARALHATGPRSDGPFVPIDCGALPADIIESELFGHEKGAFTGAVGAPGLFRMAQGGTLFLDEIGELPPAVQAKLLRVLQQREVRPVGGTRPVSVDIRVVSATHRDLERMVGEGRFRTDLYYRLNVVKLEVPPLRERPGDIPLLVHHFLAKHASEGSARLRIDEEALEDLALREWPGNVRELENTIESALALSTGTQLRRIDVLQPGAGASLEERGSRMRSLSSVPLTLEAYERCALERALRLANGDATKAARHLGIGRSTFYRKLAKQGLRVPGAVPAPHPGLVRSGPIR